MLPVLHIDEEALRPRIEAAKLQPAQRRTYSFQQRRDHDAAIVSRLVRSRSINSRDDEVSSRLGMRRERCASCGEPVFLAEKLVVARSAYHRSCFRCARCQHQLTPGNYYETEDGKYCCEACPIDDERAPPLPSSAAPQLTSQREPPDQQQQPDQPAQLPDHLPDQPVCSEAALLEAPLSDEEKSQRQLEQRQRCASQEPEPQPEPQHKFDHMLKLINDRIDQLTADETPAAPAAPTSLHRSSSLRLVSCDHNTKDLQTARRRLSLGQDRPEAQLQPLEPRDQQPAEHNHPHEYPDDLNPFASDDEQQQSNAATRPPAVVSGNPFGSDDDDDEDDEDDDQQQKQQQQQQLQLQLQPPKPMARTKSKRRVLEAPQINLNPFWSDDDGPDSETELRDKSPPVARPRTLRHSHLEPKSNLTISSVYSSNTSIASCCSSMTPGGTYRKKKPAPPPPPPATPPRSLEHSNSSSLSPRLTPRTRKTKAAPPPPAPPALPPSLADDHGQLQTTTDSDKLSKDEANRNTRSLSYTESSLLYPGQLDKSLEGKWKRKKGPAPPRPMPLRRKIKVMSMKDVKLELDQIEMQQQGLERQGVRLEQIIRDKCESGTASEEPGLGVDVEELVLELFALVNEKNELFRRQAELMLLRRQQRLEEEHADIEYQVRCLITQPEATKTDFDKQREETLIQRLVEIVEKRNEIVECLEMDRRREIEEDRSINREMDLYAARNKAENVNITDESRRSTLKFKKAKLKEKLKEKKSKKSSKKDADKDVDETEAKLKRHTLRKWF